MNECQFQDCILSPRVLDFVVDQCEHAYLPFSQIFKIVKLCTISLVSDNPISIVEQRLECKAFYSKLSALRIDSKRLVDAICDYPELAMTNELVFRIILLIERILPIHIDPLDLSKKLIEPDFGTKPFIDGLENQLRKASPDEMVRIVLNIAALLPEYACELAAQIKGLCTNSKIRSPTEVKEVTSQLIKMIANARYLNLEEPCASFVIFDDLELIKSAFFVDQSYVVQEALKNPQLYSDRARTRRRNQELFADTCILYSLTLESQKTINMHDLFVSFVSKIHSGTRKSSSEQRRIYAARFIHASYELEYLGVWAPVGRKRDHFDRRNFCDSIDY